MLFITLVVFVCAVLPHVNCGVFDYTELDDPMQYFWGNYRTPTLGGGSLNGECTTTSVTGAPVSGVCQLRGECLRSGGTPKGFCGLWSVCCTYPKTCGKTTKSKISYFSNGPDPVQPCRYTVSLTNNNICQMRIDFLQLTLAGPTLVDVGQVGGQMFQAAICTEDVLTIESVMIKVPKICGENAGQHVYIPVNASQSVDSVSINVDLATRVSGSTLPTPVWSIKVTQLECPGPARIQNTNVQVTDFPQLAPHGCLQFFTAPIGVVKSFGYLLGYTKNLYVIDQKYAICFKKPSNKCSIRFMLTAFELGTSSGMESMCSDHLFIPEVTGQTTNFVAKFCGQMIDIGGGIVGQPIEIFSTSPGPLYVNFVADSTSVISENGFEFNYELQC